MDTGILSILSVFDSALPIGAYTHSNGLETYAQKGKIKDAEGLEEFMRNYFAQNFLYNEALPLFYTYQFAEADKNEELIELDELLTATKYIKELKESSQMLGKRLMKIGDLWGIKSKIYHYYTQKVKNGEILGHYSIVIALLCHSLKVKKEEMVSASFYHAASAMITNGVKLLPIGQMAGQEILFSLQNNIVEWTDQVLNTRYEEIGRSTVGYDIFAMQHEQLPHRMFMS